MFKDNGFIKSIEGERNGAISLTKKMNKKEIQVLIIDDMRGIELAYYLKENGYRIVVEKDLFKRTYNNKSYSLYGLLYI